MTEAELQAIQDWGNSFQTFTEPHKYIAKLVREIRSLRSQLVSPSEELVEAVQFALYRASSIPPLTGNDAAAGWAGASNLTKVTFGAMARAALSAIAKHLGLSGERLEEMER